MRARARVENRHELDTFLDYYYWDFALSRCCDKPQATAVGKAAAGLVYSKQDT